MNYTHLFQDKRYQIAVLRKAGHLQGDIAKLLDQHTSTIGREVRRNTGLRCYRPKQAHALCVERAVACQNGPRIPQNYSLFAHALFKTAALVSAALTTLLAPYAGCVHTLTTDDGKEFAMHEVSSKALQAEHHFAHPYRSWERGANENMNGLIREFFPQKHGLQHHLIKRHPRCHPPAKPSTA